MQTLDRVRETPKRTTRRRSRLPVYAVVLIGGAAYWLGSAGALIAIGIVTIAAALATRSGAREYIFHTCVPFDAPLNFLWLLIVLTCGVSFVVSGITHAASGHAHGGRAWMELSKTLLAAVLYLIWIVGISLPARKNIIYTALFTLSVLEIARLLAFGIGPGVLSVLIWFVTGISAYSLRAERPHPLI